MTACLDSQQFWAKLHARVASFDLLAHPFYQAWSAGQLSAQDLRHYAASRMRISTEWPLTSLRFRSNKWLILRIG